MVVAKRRSYTINKPIKRSPKVERTYQGILFASKTEMKRYIDLVALQFAGHIRNLKRQVNFKFILPNGVPVRIGNRKQVAHFTLDFQYEKFVGWDKDGNAIWNTVYEDVKIMHTRDSILRVALVEAIYGITINLVKP